MVNFFFTANWNRINHESIYVCLRQLIKDFESPSSLSPRFHCKIAFLYVTVVPSVWKSRSRLAAERNATAISILIVLLADSPSSFVVNNFAGAHSAGERSECGMPSVQEVHDQSGVSLQPEVAICKRWLTWSRRKKKGNCERARR